MFIGNNPLWVTWTFQHPKAVTWIADYCTSPHVLPIMTAGSHIGPGVLLGYGPGFDTVLRRWPYYIDRILRGAKPGDLPLQLPEDYELVLNLAVARKLRIEVPPSLLVRADKVHEDEAGGADPKWRSRF